MKENYSWVGKKVRLLECDVYKDYPKYYPVAGTIGVVQDSSGNGVAVKWPDGSTSENDVWFCDKKYLELVEDDTNIPYGEIWEMLEPKMEKNGLISHSGYIKIESTDLPGYHHRPVKTYDEDDVQKAIALAYKIGYMRAMKGRPFKYANTTKVEVRVENLENDSDKCPNAPCCAKSVVKKRVVRKKTGHWEKVDPKNLPKIGSKVRYTRPDGEEHLKPIYIGKEGQFWRSEVVLNLGLRDTKGDWYDFDNHLNCLDVWVEGEGDAE